MDAWSKDMGVDKQSFVTLMGDPSAVFTKTISMEMIRARSPARAPSRKRAQQHAAPHGCSAPAAPSPSDACAATGERTTRELAAAA
eukprot:973097-Prymnesium_polylepis.1